MNVWKPIVWGLGFVCLGIAIAAPLCGDDDDDNAFETVACCYFECANGSTYAQESTGDGDLSDLEAGCRLWAHDVCDGNEESDVTRVAMNDCACEELTCPPDWWPEDNDNLPENTYYDSNTGLTWQTWSGREGEYAEGTYPQLQEYCANLSWGGLSGWRIPTISELRSLVIGCPATATDGSCEITDACTSEEECDSPNCWGCDGYAGPNPDGFYWPAEMSLGRSPNYVSSDTTISDVPDGRWTMFFVSAHIQDTVGNNGYSTFLCVQ